MYHRRARGWVKHADFFVVDALTLVLAMVLAYAIVFRSYMFENRVYVEFWMLLEACDAFVYLIFESMHNVLKRGYYVELKATLRHCFYMFSVTFLALYSWDSVQVISKRFLTYSFIIHFVLSYCTRIFWKWFVKKYNSPISKKKRILTLLNPATAEKTILRLNHSPVKNYVITGIIINSRSGPPEIDGVPVVAFIDTAADYIARVSVDAIYVDCLFTDPEVSELLEICVQMGIPIHYHVPSIFGEESNTFFEEIGGDMTLTSTLNELSVREQLAKRGMDIIGGLIGSCFAVLAILIIGPMIKIASPGPILFAQERIGMNGRRFKMYKLRSMYMDAEERKKELMAQNKVANGLMFKMDNDPRIIGNKIMPDGTCKTGIGDFIRRTSLDEFPQFFNVLIGQMSLVGTRPPTLDEWERYEYHHRSRMACKPGITGLWQVSGRSEITDFEEVVKLDTQYIANWSFGLDLQIIFKTIKVVFDRRGAL